MAFKQTALLTVLLYLQYVQLLLHIYHASQKSSSRLVWNKNHIENLLQWTA